MGTMTDRESKGSAESFWLSNVECRKRGLSLAGPSQVHSLAILQEKLWASNGRYLAFLSAIEEPGSTPRDLDKIARPVRKNGRSYRGFNLFHGDDLNLFHAMIRGEFNIGGLTNKAIRTFLPNTTPQQIVGTGVNRIALCRNP